MNLNLMHERIANKYSYDAKGPFIPVELDGIPRKFRPIDFCYGRIVIGAPARIPLTERQAFEKWLAKPGFEKLMRKAYDEPGDYQP